MKNMNNITIAMVNEAEGNINHGELKVGNWTWSCIVEGGAIEDWG